MPKMKTREIRAKSILRKHKKIDSWFLTRYGMNLYRGCQHDCKYCDGRSEKYQVEAEFDQEVAVKINAIEILERELDPQRKRKPLFPGFVMLGGGVGDSYQPLEKRYKLSRKTLALLQRFNHPVHILTKSTLVERDLDIIKQINHQNKAVVSFSFSSMDDQISSTFEPGVAPPSQRLKTIHYFKKNGIPCGIYLMPVIPFITDNDEQLTRAFREAESVDANFLIFGGMTLKEGRQKDFYLKILKHHYPDLLPKYQQIYQPNKWGEAKKSYYEDIHNRFYEISLKFKIPVRIPPSIYQNRITSNDRVIVILEHLDYLYKMAGKPSSYGYAAYAISQLKEPVNERRDSLKQIKGIGVVTEKIIREILKTKRSSLYESILNSYTD